MNIYVTEYIHRAVYVMTVASAAQIIRASVQWLYSLQAAAVPSTVTLSILERALVQLNAQMRISSACAQPAAPQGHQYLPFLQSSV